MNRLSLFVVAALAAAACGPSAADVNRAKTVSYNTDFATVWNAVAAEMHERYEPAQIKIEDGAAGVIVSEWKLVTVSQEGTEGASEEITGRGRAGAVRQGTFARSMVRINKDGPPWHIDIDVEAAEFKANLSMLVPYKHGAADEPPWVPGRIDALHVAFYKRLEKHAVATPAGAKKAPASAPAPAAPAPAPAADAPAASPGRVPPPPAPTAPAPAPAPAPK